MPTPSNAGPTGTPQGQRTTRPLLLASEYFARRTADPTSVTNALIVRGVPAQIKAVDEAKRVLRVRITDATPDRYRDVVQPKGGDFTNFQANPVVPWAHDYWGLPVARDTGLDVEPDAIYGNPQFPTAEEHAFADTVYRLCVAGYINGASIGFMPKKWAYDEDRRGYDILEWDLWEYSIVAIPANPSCLIEARSAGIDIAPIATWAEEMLAGVHGAGGWVSKDDAEAAYFIAAGEKKIFIPRSALKGIEPDDVRAVLTGAAELRDASGAVLRTFATREADAGAEGAGETGDRGAGDAIDVSADLGKAVETFLASGQGVDALTRALTRAGAQPSPASADTPAVTHVTFDPADLIIAAAQLIDEKLAPLQGAFTSATGHLG